MSITDLNAFTESWLIEARKFPAAPALWTEIQMFSQNSTWYYVSRTGTYMTKSSPPSSLTQRSTESFRLSYFRTSTAPIPMTLAPVRDVAMSLAAASVFSTFLPTIQASAPRCTRARTWAEQIVPAPPVQKTTLFSGSIFRRS